MSLILGEPNYARLRETVEERRKAQSDVGKYIAQVRYVSRANLEAVITI